MDGMIMPGVGISGGGIGGGVGGIISGVTGPAGGKPSPLGKGKLGVGAADVVPMAVCPGGTCKSRLTGWAEVVAIPGRGR